MRSTTYYCNLLLVFVILFISLLLVVDTALADHQTQTKLFWNNGYSGRARTLPSDNKQWQWYLTETDSTWYNLHVWEKGWLYQWPSGYYQNSVKSREGWWSTTSDTITMFENKGRWTNGRHRAILHPGGNANIRYTSAKQWWDTETCFNDLNHSSCD